MAVGQTDPLPEEWSSTLWLPVWQMPFVVAHDAFVTRRRTGLLACPSSCYKCGGSYYERHLPHWQPEGAALFLTWRLARIAPENRADLGSPWVKLFQQIRAGQWFRYFNGAEVLAGVLVLISWTATAGLALLACTMAAADSIFSGIFFIALSAFWWGRRSR